MERRVETGTLSTRLSSNVLSRAAALCFFHADTCINVDDDTAKQEKVIAMFEPNLNVVKTSIIPVYIAESLFRRKPKLVHKVIVTNSADMIAGNDASAEFIKFAGSLDLLDEGKIAFEGRYKTPFFLSKSVDVVISHQWSNELNFLYLDVLHARYPLVHNSPFFKECGYYYPEHDVEAGARALELALTTHDDNVKEYNAKADACIYKYHTRNPRNTAGFEALIRQLVQQPEDGISYVRRRRRRRRSSSSTSSTSTSSTSSTSGNGSEEAGKATEEEGPGIEKATEPREKIKKRDESGYAEGMNDIVRDGDSSLPVDLSGEANKPKMKVEYVGPPIDEATGKPWIEGDDEMMSHEEAQAMYKRIEMANKGRFRRVGEPVVRAGNDMVVLEATAEAKAADTLGAARATAEAAQNGNGN